MYLGEKLAWRMVVMSKNRLTYQNWIVDIGFDPEAGCPTDLGRRESEEASADLDPGAASIEGTTSPGIEQPVSAQIRREVAASHARRDKKMANGNNKHA